MFRKAEACTGFPRGRSCGSASAWLGVERGKAGFHVGALVLRSVH